MSTQQDTCAHTLIHWRPGPPVYWECQGCFARWEKLDEKTMDILREAAREFFGHGKPRS